MYSITITKTEIRETPAGKDWEIINRDINDKPEYGYTPEITKKKTVEIAVLTQQVEDLDLVKVIKAINGIEQ